MRGNRSYRAVFSAWLVLVGLCGLARAQATSANSGTIEGTVVDQSGAVVKGAVVTILDPVSQYTRTATTGDDGKFSFLNVPFSRYHTTVVAPGFQGFVQDVDVSSSVPAVVPVKLAVGSASTTMTVVSGGDLLQTSPATHTDIDRALFDKLPLESSSSGLSSLVTLASPGIAADSNGLFHGLGDHASNSFSLDGQPITDQQSKVFSNQLPVDAVQSLQVIEGAPPAQYGDKTSTVIVVTTRSGLGDTQPHGDVTASYGTFGTANGGFDLGWGGQNWGNFISANGLNTGRFLDGPEEVVFHDHGNEENFFDRIDYKFSQASSFSTNLEFTRSWFQTPNSYDAQFDTAWNGLVESNGGLGPNGALVGSQDQRSQILTFNVAPVWTYLMNPHSVLTVAAWFRKDDYHYYPSDDPYADLTADLQLQTVAQSRRLSNGGLRSSWSYVNGNNNVLVGADMDDTWLYESDHIGLVDPLTNPVCLVTATGAADTDPNTVSASQCTGPYSPNPTFNPLLACYDLTRTAALPGSDGCSTTYAEDYDFLGNAEIKEESAFVQDTITWSHFTVDAGVRADFYNGLASKNALEPRFGGSYAIARTNTVLKASYAEDMETPFNENLVLASAGCSNPAISAIMSSTISPCVTGGVPLTPGIRHEYHAGLEQAFGRHLVIDGEYIWVYTDNAFDFSVLGNTPITFPIEWDKSKIPGLALRATMPVWHGITAYSVMSHVEARFFNPQVAGIGSVPSGPAGTVFRIDHDEAFNQTTHVQYQPWRNGPWISANWRYDSGLVAGPVPCAGGEDCANGPNGTGSIVDVSALTPDQQFEAGLFCGATHATPFTPISPNDLCPASEYGSTLVRIPAAGTESDDHNPPRIMPRNLYDLALGQDNLLRRKEGPRLSADITVINLTNKEALYNFLSTFSGTHYVAPRTVALELGYHF